MYQSSTKTPKKVFQKGGFCLLKRGFLHAKSMVFAMQKGGFCNTGCFLFKMYRVYWGQQKMVLWVK